MKILGINLTKIYGEKKEQNFKDIEITTTINFLNFEKKEIDFIKEETFVLKFNFKINYQDKGSIEFEGEILISLSGDEVGEFNESWKNKKVPTKFAPQLYSAVMKKCARESISLQEELGMPSPFLALPRIQAKEN